MNRENMVLYVLAAFLFAAGLATGQDVSASTSNATNINSSSPLDLKYIWSVSGIEEDQIIIALNQEQGDLFGQAKYETENGEPWNGEVAGYVFGDQVHLVLTALKGDTQISTALKGIFADEAIIGEFFQTSKGEVLRRGEFHALWINPDLSSYTPAEIEESESELAPAEDLIAPADIESQQAQQKSSFYDVRQDADRILTGVGDISQIPIGMGGSGLGGGSGMA